MTVDELVHMAQSHCQQWNMRYPLPCSEAEIAKLQSRFRERFNSELPDQYCDFLRLSNGLFGDGVEIYGATPWFAESDSEHPTTDGLLEAHEGRELDGVVLLGIVVFGIGEAQVVYALDLATQQFKQFDIYGKPLRDFDSFEDMFRFMFEGRV